MRFNLTYELRSGELETQDDIEEFARELEQEIRDHLLDGEDIELISSEVVKGD